MLACVRSIAVRPLVLLAAASLALAACGGGGGTTTHAISGTVSGATGVTLTLGGAGSGTATSGTGGAYAFTGLANGAYTVTPARTGYLFTPSSRSVALASADVSGIDFQAAALPVEHAISGTVTGATGVTLTLGGAGSGTTTSGTGGAYAFTGLANGAYTVTPSRTGYVFTPSSRSVTLAGADLAEVDFTATLVVAGERTVSGAVTGAVLDGVTVTLGGAAERVTATDAAGQFAFTLLPAGVYTVTPSAAGVLFAPSTRSAVVSTADVALDPFAGEALVAYPGPAGMSVDARLWDGAARHARPVSGVALLGVALTHAPALKSYPVVLSVLPEALGGQVTSVRARMMLNAAAATGDTTARAGIDLVFQPLAYRVAAPHNQARALYLRVALSQTGSDAPVAVRQAFECTSDDCSTTSGVGTSSGATWASAGAAATTGAYYTVSITIDPAARLVTYSLSGGAYTTPLVATIDLSAGSPPFPVDLSAANAFRTRLFAQVRGGATGGGDGSLEATFDDVALGQGGGALTAFDDFQGVSRFDPARWSVGEESIVTTRPFPPQLYMVLAQEGRPAVNGLNLSSTPRALQARVGVESWSQAGGGQLGARLAAALYNDGSGGLGTAPDVPGPGSQVGDLIAQISRTRTDVSVAVVRCNVAVCSAATGAGLTFVKERASLGTLTSGASSVLLLAWDAASHTVMFQLDGNPPVVFNPVAAGYPVVGAPGHPFWQLGTHASAAGPGVDFAAGSSGRISALFWEVKTL